MQENSLIRKRHARTKSQTEPAARELTYQQQYARIARKEVSASLMSREEEEVFGSVAEDSVRAEFKRNHKDVWKFITAKKSQEPTTSTPSPTLTDTRRRPNCAEIEARREEKRVLGQRLHEYLRKWKPALSSSKGGSSRAEGLHSRTSTVGMRS